MYSVRPSGSPPVRALSKHALPVEGSNLPHTKRPRPEALTIKLPSGAIRSPVGVSPATTGTTTTVTPAGDLGAALMVMEAGGSLLEVRPLSTALELKAEQGASPTDGPKTVSEAANSPAVSSTGGSVDSPEPMDTATVGSETVSEAASSLEVSPTGGSAAEPTVDPLQRRLKELDGAVAIYKARVRKTQLTTVLTDPSTFEVDYLESPEHALHTFQILIKAIRQLKGRPLSIEGYNRFLINLQEDCINYENLARDISWKLDSAFTSIDSITTPKRDNPRYSNKVLDVLSSRQFRLSELTEIYSDDLTWEEALTTAKESLSVLGDLALTGNDEEQLKGLVAIAKERYSGHLSTASVRQGKRGKGLLDIDETKKAYNPEKAVRAHQQAILTFEQIAINKAVFRPFYHRLTHFIMSFDPKPLAAAFQTLDIMGELTDVCTFLKNHRPIFE